MSVSELDYCAVEVEVLWVQDLLPGLQRWHTVEAEFVRETSDWVGGIVECDRDIVVIVVWIHVLDDDHIDDVQRYTHLSHRKWSLPRDFGNVLACTGAL